MLGFACPYALRSVRILMTRPGYLSGLRQNAPSPKIVLDSNLNALENAANGKTFLSSTAGLSGNVAFHTSADRRTNRCTEVASCEGLVVGLLRQSG